MHQIMDGFTAAGATDIIKVPKEVRKISVCAQYRNTDSDNATAVSAISLAYQTLPTYEIKDNDDGLLSSPTLQIGSGDAKDLEVLEFNYKIAGATYNKAAAADVPIAPLIGNITISKYGGFWVQINAAGTLTCIAPNTPQGYATDADVVTALDALSPNNGNIFIGRVLVQNDGALWTAGTHDLTPGGEVTKSHFTDEPLAGVDIDAYHFSRADIATRTAWWEIDNHGERNARIFLKALIGTGAVDCFVSMR